jgi:myo-inositol-1-phosphate synthase
MLVYRRIGYLFEGTFEHPRTTQEKYAVVHQRNVQIAPADGKLGVLIPGIGAVSTTFMAGVEAVKRGLGQPMDRSRSFHRPPGKAHRRPLPLIKDFVPLAGLERPGLRRMGHLRRHRVRSRGHQRQGAGRALLSSPEPLSAIKPMKAVFDPNTSAASTART